MRPLAKALASFVLVCIVLPAVMFEGIRVSRGYAPSLEVLSAFVLFAPLTFPLYVLMSVAYSAATTFRASQRPRDVIHASMFETLCFEIVRSYVVLSVHLVVMHQGFSTRSLAPPIPVAVVYGVCRVLIVRRFDERSRGSTPKPLEV